MKNLSITAILCLALSFPLCAQEGLHLGVQVTPHSPIIFNQNNYGDRELEYKFTFGYAAGAELGYHFTDQLGIFTGFQYASQGQEYEDVDNQQNQVNRHVMLDYFRVPLYFRYNSPGDAVGFYLNAGAYMGFLNSAEIEYTVGNVDLGTPEADERFVNTEFGLLAGLGARFNFSPQLYGTAGLRFTYGLQDMNDEDWQIPNQDGEYEASHNASIGINLGLAYIFEMR